MRPSTTITMLDRSNIFFFATDTFCLSALLVIAYLVFIYSISSLYSLKTRGRIWTTKSIMDC